MYTFNQLQCKVTDFINTLDYTVSPEGLYEPMTYILGLGGKRIRPVLVLMGANLFTDKLDNIYLPAIGLEVFHNFTLLHDDVMDKADMRRSKPTVHKKWNDNVAILSGDAMSIKAYQYIVTCEDRYLRDVLFTFNSTALEVCEGQQLDMEFETRNDVSVDEYLNMIKLKTAVLLACSLKMGAILANASKEDAQLLYQFGIDLGMAFQLQDDLLDVFGDQKVFGKKIGGDIIANKKTFLLIKAQELAKGENADILSQQLALVDFNAEEKIKTVKNIYEELNLRELSEAFINEYITKCLLSLDKINVDKEIKKELYTVVDKLLNREK